MQTHNQPAREGCEYIEHLATDEELDIEEIVCEETDKKQNDRSSPVEPAKPVADIPLTGVPVCSLDGIVVVGEWGTLEAGENGKKTANRFQRKGL